MFNFLKKMSSKPVISEEYKNKFLNNRNYYSINSFELNFYNLFILFMEDLFTYSDMKKCSFRVEALGQLKLTVENFDSNAESNIHDQIHIFYPQKGNIEICNIINDFFELWLQHPLREGDIKNHITIFKAFKDNITSYPIQKSERYTIYSKILKKYFSDNPEVLPDHEAYIQKFIDQIKTPGTHSDIIISLQYNNKNIPVSLFCFSIDNIYQKIEDFNKEVITYENLLYTNMVSQLLHCIVNEVDSTKLPTVNFKLKQYFYPKSCAYVYELYSNNKKLYKSPELMIIFPTQRYNNNYKFCINKHNINHDLMTLLAGYFISNLSPAILPDLYKEVEHLMHMIKIKQDKNQLQQLISTKPKTVNVNRL